MIGFNVVISALEVCTTVVRSAVTSPVWYPIQSY